MTVTYDGMANKYQSSLIDPSNRIVLKTKLDDHL